MAATPLWPSAESRAYHEAQKTAWPEAKPAGRAPDLVAKMEAKQVPSSSLLLSSLELSDTNVYEPQMRARLGTAALHPSFVSVYLTSLVLVVPSPAFSEERQARAFLPLAAFSIALLCSTRRRIPARVSANHGSEKGNLVQEERKVQRASRAASDDKLLIMTVRLAM